jgi:2'-5' RNA ligase
MKRTFIAISIKAGKNLEDVLTHLRSELKRDSVRWVDPGNMHLTLAFLGDTQEDIIEEVSKMLIDRCKDLFEFDFIVSGLGVFKNPENPRVIWAGIERSEAFTGLSGTINTGLYDLGIKTEDRQFKPHLTLGRVRSLKNTGSLKSLLQKYDGMIFQEAKVSEIVYYESVLQQTGPIYTPIITVPLKSGTNT